MVNLFHVNLFLFKELYINHSLQWNFHQIRVLAFSISFWTLERCTCFCSLYNLTYTYQSIWSPISINPTRLSTYIWPNINVFLLLSLKAISRIAIWKSESIQLLVPTSHQTNFLFWNHSRPFKNWLLLHMCVVIYNNCIKNFVSFRLSNL